MVYPDKKSKVEYIDKRPDKLAYSQVEEVFNRLSAIDHSEQIRLKFYQNAQAVFIEWFKNLEQKLSGDLHPAIESHLTKYRSLIPSLALIISLADNQDNYEGVNLEAIKKACLWADYLESHMRRVYAIADSRDAQNAQMIIDRFDKLDDVFTARDIHQKNWTGLGRNKETVLNALELLENNHYIRSVERATGGRRTIDYEKTPS